MPARFERDVAQAIGEARRLNTRAGEVHRFIGIWAVEVEGRIFVASWGLTERGWYREFGENPKGSIDLSGLLAPIQALPVRSERLLALVDCAYLSKFATRGGSS